MLRNLLQGMVIAFAMYSKLPCPRVDWNEKNMRYCICFFPLIGCVIGAAICLWRSLADRMQLGDLMRSAVFVFLPIAITGGIHMDGLLDTADALSSYKTLEEKLEILKDSHAGAFAIIVCGVYLLLQFGAYSELDQAGAFLVGCGFVLSRAYSGLALVTFPKAKNTGLLRTFSDAAVNRRVAVTMVCYIGVITVVMICLDPARGSFAALLALATFFWYGRMSRRKFGGITGDLAGFFLQICELMILLGVVLR